MDDDLASELRDTGGQRALYVALIAAIEAHPRPARAARAAHSAIERELVSQLNQRGAPQPWLDALLEMQNRLATTLRDRWPDQ